MINKIIIASNPFFDAYSDSDLLGKLIFVGLILLSISSWIILIHKIWLTKNAEKNSADFQKDFYVHRSNPLNLNSDLLKKDEVNPFLAIYLNLKRTTLELLNKNRQDSTSQTSYLSAADIDYVEGHLVSTINAQVKGLEKNLYVLSTVVSLAPFLGLLGTVWGILTTFSEMTAQTSGGHQAILGGLSLALATTVLGLVGAIPALIGYNYLKNSIQDFETDMSEFAHQALSSIELQYRKVDIQ